MKIREINLLLFFLCLLSTNSQAAFINNYCTNTTVSPLNSEYEANLNVVFQYLVSNATSPSGFHVAVSGKGANAVYGLFLCRGDQNTTACKNCVSSATSALINVYCINYQQSFIWFDECMVRHTNESLLDRKMEVRPATVLGAEKNVSKNEIGQLEQNLGELMYNLPEDAAKSQSGRKFFATRVVRFSSSRTLYALAQCTPDLTSDNCTKCLTIAIKTMQLGPAGGMLQPSCNLMFGSDPFFNDGYIDVTPPQVSPAPHSNRTSQPAVTPATRTHSTTALNWHKELRIIIISISVSALVLMVIFFISMYWYTNRRKTPKKLQQTEDQISGVDSLEFDLDTIQAATRNFSPTNKLGEGGFGAVYKGTLPNGREIAVKRLWGNNTKQGDGEFKNEILLLARLQHKNLVRLLGFCLDNEERILIFEYVPNASLDHFLFDSAINGYLDWDKRRKIIGGIVRGLLYLHEDSRLKIIHRDLKASNILLDDGMNPKIADFGLAKLFAVDQTTADTSKIAGTLGYMAPEYERYGVVSVRTDVYSFGVVLLEIICGRKNRGFYGEDSYAGLVSLVWKKWREGTVLSIIDPMISSEESSRDEITRYIHIALLCVQENAADRPTMSSIALMLRSEILPLQTPSNPGFVAASSSTSPFQEVYSSQSDNTKSTINFSVNEDSVSDLLPR